MRAARRHTRPTDRMSRRVRPRAHRPPCLVTAWHVTDFPDGTVGVALEVREPAADGLTYLRNGIRFTRHAWVQRLPADRYLLRGLSGHAVASAVLEGHEYPVGCPFNWSHATMVAVGQRLLRSWLRRLAMPRTAPAKPLHTHQARWLPVA